MLKIIILFYTVVCLIGCSASETADMHFSVSNVSSARPQVAMKILVDTLQVFSNTIKTTTDDRAATYTADITVAKGEHKITLAVEGDSIACTYNVKIDKPSWLFIWHDYAKDTASFKAKANYTGTNIHTQQFTHTDTAGNTTYLFAILTDKKQLPSLKQ
jgi:hypothetical protein